MTEFDAIEAELHSAGLGVLGGFFSDGAEAGIQKIRTLFLVGPVSPDFWAVFKQSPQYSDGLADPMDRWSARVLEKAAKRLMGHVFLPSSGPPYLPFFEWALRTGQCFMSPVQMLVHKKMGLMVSFRGALGFESKIEFSQKAPLSPCDACSQPCLSACPVGAFKKGYYDVASCHSYLDKDADVRCLKQGCMARVVCPLGQAFGRDPEQSAFHMRAFHGSN